MDDEELILHYFGKLSRIMIELKSLGYKVSNVDLSAKLLRSVSSKFDSITTSIEQFQNLDTISIDEILITLKIYEDKLQDHYVKREEKALLAHALKKNKKKHSSNGTQARGRGRGCGKGRGYGRGRGRSATKIEDFDDDEKLRDKLIVTCYICQNKGYYVNECRFPKERLKMNKEKTIVAEEHSSNNSLLMAFEDSNGLLQGISQFE
ncbi:unnamed protein product [Spirodela intermedia]|uniref:Uncharacterized protein n=1 Tax=Spirodela intermedia TaxID=51605 RepID=A0A7I8IXP3_SPIIN|nr:unnamed protein product [Spirodela intermedia]CAA6662618.1 unnamed protein product [Spirodela intermedia]